MIRHMKNLSILAIPLIAISILAASSPTNAQGSNAGWVEIGVGSASGSGIGHLSNVGNWPSLALDSDGSPMVAWQDTGSGDAEIYVRRWNGTTWVEVGSGSAFGGGISSNGGESLYPSLAITPDGTPFVAWQDDTSGDNEIYVRRWNGSSWVEMGNGSASGGGISNNSGASTWPSLAVDLDGMPIVAWEDNSSGDDEIYVRRWNGTKWDVVGSGSASGGGISNNDGNSELPSLAIGSNGTAYVAWHDNSDGYHEIFLRRWNGSAWVEMGSGSASGSGISDTDYESHAPSLAVGPDGRPVVAWHDFSSGTWEIYVRKWNGSAWGELGADSASGGGISDDGFYSFWPSVAITPDGMPLVSWYDSTSGNDEIYIRGWTGMAWEELTTGSATMGGISDNDGSSAFPSLAVAPDGKAIVAWGDGTSGTAKVYVRRSPVSLVTCFNLSVDHTGQGANPAVSPPNSAGCEVGHYFSGQELSLTASPAMGWRVKNWSGTANNSSTGDTNTAIMPPANHTISVTYTKICFTLTLSHTGQGSDPEPMPGNSLGCAAGQYTAGEEINLTANPAAGWRIVGWTGTSNNSSTAGSNSLIMPSTNHTVSVRYERITNDPNEIFLPNVLYQLPPGPTCFSGPNEVEPNNNQGQANGPLCASGTYQGLPNDRFDYFMLETNQSGSIQLVITNHRGTGVQVQLYYHTASGSPVAFDTEQSDGLSLQFQQALPGRYYIVIYAENPKPTEPTRYAIQISFP